MDTIIVFFQCTVGLKDAICASACGTVQQSVEYQSLMSLLARQPLVAAKTPFVRSSLSWIGGSLFASVRVRFMYGVFTVSFQYIWSILIIINFTFKLH